MVVYGRLVKQMLIPSAEGRVVEGYLEGNELEILLYRRANMHRQRSTNGCLLVTCVVSARPYCGWGIA